MDDFRPRALWQVGCIGRRDADHRKRHDPANDWTTGWTTFVEN
jgi:hypothetical protein